MAFEEPAPDWVHIRILTDRDRPQDPTGTVLPPDRPLTTVGMLELGGRAHVFRIQGVNSHIALLPCGVGLGLRDHVEPGLAYVGVHVPAVLGAVLVRGLSQIAESNLSCWTITLRPSVLTKFLTRRERYSEDRGSRPHPFHASDARLKPVQLGECVREGMASIVDMSKVAGAE
ncbi:hypothetical protein TruAng_001113 [Truncatella angustata]|nr:hypothetical protein TruAng_001113 [Truncatella angustata]